MCGISFIFSFIFSFIVEVSVEDMIPYMYVLVVNLYPLELGHPLRALLVSFTALLVPGLGPSFTTLESSSMCFTVSMGLCSTM